MYAYKEQELKLKLGKLLAEKRKAINLSQEELAEKLNMHVRTISKIENGHSFVSAETLCKLCKFFKLPPKSFFDIDSKQQRTNRKASEIINKIKSFDKDKLDFYYKLTSLVDSEMGR